MDVTNLRSQYEQKIKEAKALSDQYSGKESEMPAEIEQQIQGKLGEADTLRAKLDIARQLDAANAYMSEPASPAAAHLGFREAAPNEGNLAVDEKAWREVKVNTIMGEQTVRFNIPLAVQNPGYKGAFEGYLRRGFQDLGPSDRKTLTEGVDTAGGFTVPEDYHIEMIKKVATQAAIRPLARVVQTSRDIASWPRIKYTTDNKYTSGVRMTWTGESPASATTARVTDPVFGIIKIPVHTAMASMPLSNDLIEDSAFDMLGMSSDLFSEAFALGEDDIFINGTGANQPYGIVTGVDAVSGDSVASVVSGTTATVTADGLIDLYFGLPTQYRRNARFIMNSGTMKAVEKLKDSQNRYLVQSLVNGSLASPQFDTIKGKPVVIDEFVPDVGANTYPIIFGDLNGYIIVDRVGFSVQRLTEIYAETNITLLLARKRVGGYPAEPYRMVVQKCST